MGVRIAFAKPIPNFQCHAVLALATAQAWQLQMRLIPSIELEHSKSVIQVVSESNVSAKKRREIPATMK